MGMFDDLMQTQQTAAPAAPSGGMFDDLLPQKERPIQQLASQSPLMGEFKDLSKGFVHGLGNIPAGGAQLLSGGNNQAINDYIHNREQGNPNTPAFNIGSGLGEAVAGAPIAAMMPGAFAEGLGARLLSGAASGAITGGLEPVKPGENFWQQKAGQAGMGALGGVGGALGAGTAARGISGATNPDLKLMGGRLTPGQIAGGWLNDLEQKLTSFPGIGDMIKNARRGSVEDFNKTAVNRALAPIGESLDKETPIGREAITEMDSKIKNAYDTILPNLYWHADQQFVQASSNIRGNANLPKTQLDQFDNILQTQFAKALPGGMFSGKGFKEVDSEVGRLANGYLHDPSADQRNLGQALKEVQTEMRAALTRSNPQYAKQLSDINGAYADALRVSGAAASQGAKEGIFTPAQLSASVRRQDPSMRKGAFARGEARMQDLSDAGQAVLGNTIPDSGTPGRALIAMGMAGLGAEHLPYGREIVLPALAANVAGMGLYSRPAQWLAQHLMMTRPSMAQPLASLVRKASPLASAGGGGLLSNLAYPVQ